MDVSRGMVARAAYTSPLRSKPVDAHPTCRKGVTCRGQAYHGFVAGFSSYKTA